MKTMYNYLGFYKLDYGPKFRHYLISHMNKGYFACKRRNVLQQWEKGWWAERREQMQTFFELSLNQYLNHKPVFQKETMWVKVSKTVKNSRSKGKKNTCNSAYI